MTVNQITSHKNDTPDAFARNFEKFKINKTSNRDGRLTIHKRKFQHLPVEGAKARDCSIPLPLGVTAILFVKTASDTSEQLIRRNFVSSK